MAAIKLDNFGGMLPAWDAHLLPEGQATAAQNGYLYSGSLLGWRKPKLLRQLLNSAAQFVYRIPNQDSNDLSILAPDSKWLEFDDIDTKVIRTPVVQDQFQRYYFASPTASPQYNTYDRIHLDQPPWLLGVPAPGCNPGVTVSGGGDRVEVGNLVRDPPDFLGLINYAFYIPDNKIIFQQFTPIAAQLVLQSLQFESLSDSTTVQFQAALYSDLNGEPYELLTVSNTIVYGSDIFFFVVLPFDVPPTLDQNVKYWLAVISDGAYSVPLASQTLDHPPQPNFSLANTFTNGPPAFIPVPLNVGATSMLPVQLWGNCIGQGVYAARGYVYTWLTSYGEEGPPSPPTIANGWSNGVWTISLFQPDPLDQGTRRTIDRKRIYRTITSTTGVTTYFFVAELPAAQAQYIDGFSDEEIAVNTALQSLLWFPPPDDLQGFVAYTSGMTVGWRSNEVWFSEIYRPHAWPPGYVLTTETPIVGLGICGTSIVVCTEETPYVLQGVGPGNMSMVRIPLPEPCTHRGSIVSTDVAVLYQSPNGLVEVAQTGAAANLTESWITREAWQRLAPVSGTRAIKLTSLYFAFGAAVDGSSTGYTIGLKSLGELQMGAGSPAQNMGYGSVATRGRHSLGFMPLTPPNTVPATSIATSRIATSSEFSGGKSLPDTTVISAAATPSTYINNNSVAALSARSVIPLVANPDLYVRVVVTGATTAVSHMAIGVWDGDATHTNTVATPVLLSFGGVSSGYSIGYENFASDWVTAASLGSFTGSNRLVVVLDTTVTTQLNYVNSGLPTGALASLVVGATSYNVAAPNHSIAASNGYVGVISIETAPTGIVTGAPIILETQGGGATGYSARNIIPCGVNALSQVRVRLSAPAPGGGTFKTDHVSIGLWNGTATDCAAAPVELKFGGSSGFTVDPPLSAVSDWISFAGFASTDHFVVIADVNGSAGGNFPYSTTNGNTASFQNSVVPQWNVVAPGLAASFSGTIAVSQIEFRIGETVLPGLFSDSDTFPVPSVALSLQFLIPGLFSDSDTIYVPSTAASLQTVLPGLFGDSDTFPVPSVAFHGFFGGKRADGVNEPWYQFGADFGTGGFGYIADFGVIAADFAAFHSQGVKVVRWWLMSDGRYCPVFNPDGTVAGLNSGFLADIDQALQIAANNNIYLLLTIMDNLMFNEASFSGTVQQGGHDAIVDDLVTRQSFLDNALKPMLQHIAANPNRQYILGYDICNEPEAQIAGGYNGYPFFTGPAQFALSDMQAWVAQVASYIHTYSGGGLATVGSAMPIWAPLWVGLGLDFYQVHYYDWMDPTTPGSGLIPASAITSDTGVHLDPSIPVIMGEFATANVSYGLNDTAVFSARWYLDTIKAGGYIGALGWSLRGGDTASNWAAFHPVFTNWVALGGQSIAPARVSAADVFFTPTLSGGTPTLVPARVSAADVFFTPTVLGGAPIQVTNVIADPWSGVGLLLQNSRIYYYDFSDPAPETMPYVWRSKIYQQCARKNFEAVKVFFTVPPNTPEQNLQRNTQLLQTLDDGQYGILRVYTDGALFTTREIRRNGELLRIQSGGKYEDWQFEIEGRVLVSSVQAATSVKELGAI